MKFLPRSVFAALLLVLGAAALNAQSPPMGGYAPSPYYTGPYTYVTPPGMTITNVDIKFGAQLLLTNASGASASPFNTFFGSVPAANLIPGQVHDITTTISSPYACGLTAWIDYDNDGTFNDTTERVCFSTTTVIGALTMQFTPSLGVGGVRRLRVRCNYYQVGPFLCYAQYSYGEAEDYLVNLGFAIASSSPMPTAAEGSPYSEVITATNGVGNYTWTLPVTGLPPPMTAAQNLQTLVISGTPTVPGTYQFTLTVTDSKTPTPDVAQRLFQITVVPPPASIPYIDDFSTDKGWQLGTTWTRGPATAYAPGTSPPRSESGTDHSPSGDNNIIGDNIGGDYAINQSVTNWAISPMVNCTGTTNPKCRIRRWLGNAIGTSVFAQISSNGINWDTVWSQTPATGQSTIRDTSWQSITYNLGVLAINKATVQMRFGVGPTGGTVHTGWCIDDFEIFEAAASMDFREGGVPPAGTVITHNQIVGGLRNFGDIPVQRNSQPLVIAITNNTASNVSFNSPWSHAQSAPYKFIVQAPAPAFVNPLPPGQTNTFTITFNSLTTTLGTYTDTITFLHNAGVGGAPSLPFAINVQANAVDPAAGTIQVKQTNSAGAAITSGLSATGTPRDFGDQDPGAGPTAFITIWVTNAAVSGTLYMTPPDMGGTWWTDFVVDNTGFVTSLAPGASTTFKVAFDPTGNNPADRDAEIRLPCTDPLYPTSGTPPYFAIPVKGRGVTIPTNPTLTILEGSSTGQVLPHNAPAAGSPRDFGDQLISAGATATATFYIENTGGMTLSIGVPILTGVNANQFVLNTAGILTSLGTGVSTTFTIAFDPSTTGVKVAQCTFTHNDTTKSTPFLINLTGNGTTNTAAISVKAGGSGGTALSNPATATGPLNFGNRDIAAGPSATLQIYIENPGNANLTLGTPTLGGSGSTQFVLVTTGFPATVLPAGNISFTIAFDPSTTGVKNATVSFTHNATGTTTSPFIINVTGNGVPSGPIVEVHETSATGASVSSGQVPAAGGGRDLGAIDVAAGATTAKLIFIVNSGTQALSPSVPTLTGADASHFVLSTAGFPASIAAGASASVSLTFNPSSVGVKEAQLQFTHNDTLAPSPFLVPIMGTGTSATGVILTTVSLPVGDVGVPYPAATLAASQGTSPYTFSIRSGTLPAGLSLAPSGAITGTPTGPGGAFPMTFRVTDSTGGTNDAAITMAVSTAPGLSGVRGSGCSTGSSDEGFAWLMLLGVLAALAVGRRSLKRA